MNLSIIKSGGTDVERAKSEITISRDFVPPSSANEGGLSFQQTNKETNIMETNEVVQTLYIVEIIKGWALQLYFVCADLETAEKVMKSQCQQIEANDPKVYDYPFWSVLIRKSEQIKKLGIFVSNEVILEKEINR